MYPIVFDKFEKNVNGTAAAFRCQETRQIVTALPEPDQLHLFFQILKGEHTAMLKDDSIISLQFCMNCIAELESKQSSAPCKKGKESETSSEEILHLKPVPGCEELFSASALVRTTWDGKVIRQADFACQISTKPYVPGFERFAYEDVPISDR